MSTNCTTAGTVRLGWTTSASAVEPRVRDFDHADVRLDGAERIVRRLSLGGGERVEERRLSDVRETDDTELQHWMNRKREGTAAACLTPAVN